MDYIISIALAACVQVLVSLRFGWRMASEM